MKGINNITIIGRRWFQKTYGNTYHSVKVYVNGKLVGKKDFTYGYDSSFLMTAHELLQIAGTYPKTNKRMASGIGEDWYDFQQDMRNHRDKFVIDVCNVQRKKDL